MGGGGAGSYWRAGQGAMCSGGPGGGPAEASGGELLAMDSCTGPLVRNKIHHQRLSKKGDKIILFI